MKIVALISDTHIDSDVTPFPEKLSGKLTHIDLILHAGDITHPSVLDRLRVFAPVKAVRGNMDVRLSLQSLPLKSVIEVEGIRIGLSHGGGSPYDIRHRLKEMFRSERVDVIVFGHTHQSFMERDRNGLLWINPGSATARKPAPEATIGRLKIENETVTAEIIRLTNE